MMNLTENSDFRRLCEELDVLLVYLYGSQSRGQERPGSDVDLAVLLNDRRVWSGWERVEALDRLGSGVASVLGAERDLMTFRT